MKKLEKTLKALANRRRLAILKHLKENREASVGDIANTIDLSFKATSKHLSILAAIDIIEREQKSSQVFYRVARHQEPISEYLISLL
ncbi:MAG: metalloregulator ArsR/SmtB family transcription factor [bacterium]|nr:metalloregulator ArsR/SmtB family transcription factor [bacterium]